MSSWRSLRWSRLLHRPRSRSSSSALHLSPQSDVPHEASAPQARTTSAAPAVVSDPCPLGLEIVAEGIDPTVDIVAVHGLNGHREKTWTASNGVHWLRDLLPHDIPHARIFSWGYDANTHSSSRVSCQYLYGHARTLISDLCRKRKLSNSIERPIIFVAHSLGGIVVKSALIHSNAARRGALEEHRSIKDSTYGVVFMGTPHQGGNGVQLGRLLMNIASLFMPTDDRILNHLERDSEWLQQQLGQYGPISGDVVTKFAFEEYKTPTVFGGSILVVPRASAVVPGQADAESIVIHANHTDMVRYTSRGDSGYNTISEHLQIMANDAPREIRRRWEAEKRANKARLGGSGTAFMGDSPTAADPNMRSHGNCLTQNFDRRVTRSLRTQGRGERYSSFRAMDNEDRCWRCGYTSHWVRNCVVSQEDVDRIRDTRRIFRDCVLCGSPSHWADVCPVREIVLRQDDLIL